jgi:hypothetical protein
MSDNLSDRLTDNLTASKIAALGAVATVKQRFGCSTREAAQLLSVAKRKVALGYGGTVMVAPAPTALRQALNQQRPPEPLSESAQQFTRLLDKYLHEHQPSVDDRMHAQWAERDADVVKRNIANGYGKQYEAGEQ